MLNYDGPNHTLVILITCFSYIHIVCIFCFFFDTFDIVYLHTVKLGHFGQGGDFGHPLLAQYKDSISLENLSQMTSNLAEMFGIRIDWCLL